MGIPDSNSDSVVKKGRAIYENELRAQLEADHHGRFAAIDPDTRDYAVADDELSAVRALRQRHPSIEPFIVRIGSPAAYRLGGRFNVRTDS